MKTKTLITAAWIFLASLCQAQFVTVPDSQFVKWLAATIPAAMNGNQMDTTHPSVLSLKRIEVENDSIYDLTGVQYFSSLVTLDCGNGVYTITPNRLTFLPALPSTLDTLICGNNLLDSLPALPPGLRFLKCYNNPLHQLPALPNSLTYLECYNDSLTGLPAPLPSGLYYLNCGNNPLQSLPALPAGLQTLYCNSNLLGTLPPLPASLSNLNCENNAIKTLPALPPSLVWLDCSANLLGALPVLPPVLQHLDCSFNYLTSLPTLPAMLNNLECSYNTLASLPVLPGSLHKLSCNYNQLTLLPALPGALQSLSCSGNQLTTLPALPVSLNYLICAFNQLSGLPVLPPSLHTLNCYNNNITCFPLFPNSLYCLQLLSNPFNCLPNYIHPMDSVTLSFPLCQPGNTNGCAPAEGIVGFTYKDNNGNCQKEPGDGSLRNIPLTLHDNAGNFIGKFFSAVTGVYHFSEPPGTYTVSVDTAGMPFESTCSNPGVDSVITTTLLDTVNFALACKPGFDIGIQSSNTACQLIFPGIHHTLFTSVGDMSRYYGLNCAAGTSGQVQITVTGNVNYVGPAAGALTPIVSGNSYLYNITDFGLVNNAADFNLVFQTKTTAQAGDIICATVSVTPTTGDHDPSNNTYTHCYSVVNSHDPNGKEVYPDTVAGGYQDWFTYTIHFQNTGNAPAINIRIEDTLDVHLDLSTLQVLDYSHANTAVLQGNLLTFSFPNINLTDSNSSADSSKGFIQYRIKPKANLYHGTQIKNTAYIYFDYNEAIITNTAISTYVDVLPTSVNEIVQEDFSVYPNPASDILNINYTSENAVKHFEVRDLMGRTLLNSEENKINVSALPSGMYLLVVMEGEKVTAERFIKE